MPQVIAMAPRTMGAMSARVLGPRKSRRKLQLRASSAGAAVADIERIATGILVPRGVREARPPESSG